MDQPPLPELDPDAWRQIQELARPDHPNGTTDDLEAAIDIAWREMWILKINDQGTMVPRDSFPRFDDAIAALQRWRDSRGGVLLMTPTVIRGPAEQQGGLWSALIVTEDAEALTLVALIGQRVIEQASDMLNLSVGFAMVDGAIERARRLQLALAIDVDARRRAVIRAIAGELVWLRSERERMTADPTTETDLGQLDHQIQTMLAVFRDVGPATTERVLIDRLNSAERSHDNTNRAIAFTIDMVTNWRALNDTAERYAGTS